jgi:hypothetical protein
MTVFSRTAGIISAVLLLSLAFGCQRREGEAVAEYFWPLDAGSRFYYAYLADVSGTHTVEITKVHEEGDEILVETVEDFDLASGPETWKYSVNYQYRVSLGKNLIEESQEGSGQKSIILKGPVREGTKWPVPVFSKTHPNGGRKRGEKPRGRVLKGTGEIEAVRPMNILGTTYDCAVVRYHIKGEPLERLVFCRGLGIAGSLDPSSIEIEWLSQIVRIGP